MDSTVETGTEGTVWGGGNRPLGASYGKMMMWFFIVFSLVHVYLVFYHDYVEGRGTTSSMVGGWKFERDDYLRKPEKDA